LLWRWLPASCVVGGLVGRLLLGLAVWHHRSWWRWCMGCTVGLVCVLVSALGWCRCWLEARWWLVMLCRGGVGLMVLARTAAAAAATLALILPLLILRPGWGCGGHVHDMLL